MTRDLQGRIYELLTGNQQWSFTLEKGHGETYSNNLPTLYGHSVYGKGSVLEGMPQRRFIEQWETWKEAQEDIKNIQTSLRNFQVTILDGTSYVPSSQLTSHLPDSD